MGTETSYAVSTVPVHNGTVFPAPAAYVFYLCSGLSAGSLQNSMRNFFVGGGGGGVVNMNGRKGPKKGLGQLKSRP